MNESSQPLILGSTSPFRRDLLAKLGVEFSQAAPDLDESRLQGETPTALVLRLAEAKARAVAEQHPGALVIGSDQVAELDGEILGKPGSFDNACAQLRKCSGRTVRFHTGLCLLNDRTGQAQTLCEPFLVHFRVLSDDQIRRYVEKEQPLNCAGSFKSEGLGISLFRKLEGDDPNALIGLPLIRLVGMLAQEGILLP